MGGLELMIAHLVLVLQLLRHLIQRVEGAERRELALLTKLLTGWMSRLR